ATDRAARRGKVAYRHRHAVRTGAGAIDRDRRADLRTGWIRCARNRWRILGWFFHREAGGCAGLVVLVRLRVHYVDGDRATATGDAVGINVGGVVAAGNFSAAVAPLISQLVIGVKAARCGGRRQW